MKKFIRFLILIIFPACTHTKCCRPAHTEHKIIPVSISYDSLSKSITYSKGIPIHETGKIYIYGNLLFVNEFQKGIHIFDNADKSNPKNISYISIPGNVDMTVRGNYLFADNYTDLVEIDISDPNSPLLFRRLRGVVPLEVINPNFTIYASQIDTNKKVIIATKDSAYIVPEICN